MSRRRTSGRETRARLLSWDQGQAASEGLAAHVLLLEGYRDIDPSHPRGGPDGGKDLGCSRDGQPWIGAAFFPQRIVPFSKIKAKFLSDLASAASHTASGVAFVTNQELSLGEREELLKCACDTEVDLFHHERIAILLDSSRGWGLRLEYLDIDVEKEELVSHFHDQEEVKRNLNVEIGELKSRMNHLAHLAATLDDRPDVGTMIRIPEGTFRMGHGASDSSAACEVLLDAFLIDVFPTTQGQFAGFVRECPEWAKDCGRVRHGNVYYLFDWRGDSYPTGKRDHPVVWVNWMAAAAFCNWRSATEGLSSFYSEEDLNQDDVSSGLCSIDSGANGYRLPTDAQFERAARGGLVGSIYPWGNRINRHRANYGNFKAETSEVGAYAPNGLQLYDLSGNVKEWCQDWYAPRIPQLELLANPMGPKDGQYKLFKGGSWGSHEEELACSFRGWLLPPNTNPDFGFRCVRP